MPFFGAKLFDLSELESALESARKSVRGTPAELDVSDENFDFVLGELQRTGQVLKNISDQVQSRAGVLLGFTGTMLSLILGSAAATLRAHLFTATPAVALMITAMGLLVRVFLMPGLNWIDPRYLATAGTGPKIAARRTVINAYVDLWESTIPLIARKGQFIRYAILLLLSGVVILSIVILGANLINA